MFQFVKRLPKSAKLEGNDGYKPLDESKGEIRLVRFRRNEMRSSSRKARGVAILGTENLYHEIQCENFVAGSRPPYTALSYCWGSAGLRRTFMLNGRIIDVTVNLAEYIQRVTPLGPGIWSPYMWIDALCINQNDLTERSDQVLKMKQIFEEAEFIVAWLGNLDREAEGAIRSLSMRTLARINTFFDSCSRQQLDSLINEIYRNPWWTRAWVIQEATTPGDRDLTIIYGNYRVGLNKLIEMLKAILRRNVLDGEDDVTRANASKIPALQILELARMRQERVDRKSKAGTPKLELLKLLESAKYHHATDLKDKVYSVLALADDVDGSLLQPNYALSLLEVYRNTAVYILKHQKNLNLLYYCSGLGNLGSQQPSWVPTWLPQFDLPFEKVHHYNASDRGVSICDVLDDSESVLVVEGSIIDHMTDVGLPRNPDSRDEDVIRDWRGIAFSERTTSMYLGDGEASHKAFTRTLCADLANVEDVQAGRGERGCTCELPMVEDSMGEFYRAHEFTASRNRDFVTAGRQFFITSKGYMGLGQNSIRAWFSYKLCILSGFSMPVVLLQLDNVNQFRFVCTCYVDGIMDGQACKVDGFEQSLRRIEIV